MLNNVAREEQTAEQAHSFCSPQEGLGLVDFWLRALERCRRSCSASASGTRLKVEKPATDPQRNCLDWRAHQVWWINSVRKSSGNIFEGWWFFCYVFTYCWLQSWRTKLKLTPCTKLADTKWKTSKTALKTDLQSRTNFQLEFLQLMYLRKYGAVHRVRSPPNGCVRRPNEKGWFFPFKPSSISF